MTARILHAVSLAFVLLLGPAMTFYAVAGPTDMAPINDDNFLRSIVISTPIA